MSGDGLEATIDVRRGDSFRLDVELSIPPGTTVALLGPNGAGKSTSVAAIAGLLAVDRGRIVLAGEVLDDSETGRFVPPEERGVGVVFQDYLLFPTMSVLDNVAFGLRSRGVGREESTEKARSWLGRLDLIGVASRRPDSLSGGQAQRVALARALVTEPVLLLLDEPLSALDVTTRHRLRRDLADHLEAFPGPRLLITHDPAEAFLLADEIHVVEDGRVTQVGTADEIRLRPRTPYAADLGGTNLFMGFATGGAVTVGTHVLRVGGSDAAGDVLVNIRPTAVAIHQSRPEGSPRNAWETTVERVEPLGERARLAVGEPLRLTAELTRSAAEELGLVEGARIWVSVKATDITVEDVGHEVGSRPSSLS